VLNCWATETNDTLCASNRRSLTHLIQPVWNLSWQVWRKALSLRAVAPAPANADCVGCAVGAGILGGLAAGAIIGSAIANSPPGYYPPPPAAGRVLPPALLHRLIVLAGARTRIGRLAVPIALEKRSRSRRCPSSCYGNKTCPALLSVAPNRYEPIKRRLREKAKR
jgi:hypothetical protein